jgi:hypothetical protein
MILSRANKAVSLLATVALVLGPLRAFAQPAPTQPTTSPCMIGGLSMSASDPDGLYLACGNTTLIGWTGASSTISLQLKGSTGCTFTAEGKQSSCDPSTATPYSWTPSKGKFLSSPLSLTVNNAGSQTSVTVYAFSFASLPFMSIAATSSGFSAVLEVPGGLGYLKIDNIDPASLTNQVTIAPSDNAGNPLASAPQASTLELNGAFSPMGNSATLDATILLSDPFSPSSSLKTVAVGSINLSPSSGTASWSGTTPVGLSLGPLTTEITSITLAWSSQASTLSAKGSYFVTTVKQLSGQASFVVDFANGQSPKLDCANTSIGVPDTLNLGSDHWIQITGLKAACSYNGSANVIAISGDLAIGGSNPNAVTFQLSTNGSTSLSLPDGLSFSLLGTTVVTGSCQGSQSSIGFSPFSASICGTLQLPRFMQGTRTIYAAPSATSNPQPIPTTDPGARVDFNVQYSCGSASGSGTTSRSTTPTSTATSTAGVASSAAQGPDCGFTGANFRVEQQGTDGCSPSWDLDIVALQLCEIYLIGKDGTAVPGLATPSPSASPSSAHATERAKAHHRKVPQSTDPAKVAADPKPTPTSTETPCPSPVSTPIPTPAPSSSPRVVDATGFAMSARLTPQVGIRSDTAASVCISAGFNAQAMFAKMTTGSIRISLGNGQADVSNLQISISDTRRSVDGKVAVIPTNSTPITIYFADVSAEMSRSSSSAPWTYHFGGKPDYQRTALSVLQYVVALLFARWIVK